MLRPGRSEFWVRSLSDSLWFAGLRRSLRSSISSPLRFPSTLLRRRLATTEALAKTEGPYHPAEEYVFLDHGWHGWHGCVTANGNGFFLPRNSRKARKWKRRRQRNNQFGVRQALAAFTCRGATVLPFAVRRRQLPVPNCQLLALPKAHQ